MPSAAPPELSAVASPPARRTALPSWFDARLFLGVLLVVVAAVSCARLVAAADHRVTVVAVRGDRAAGTILTAADVSAVRVRLPVATLRTYLRAPSDAAGLVLNRSVRDGELLATGALGSPPASTTVVIPFDNGTAPKLSTGQRITVWVAAKSCAARVLLADVAVQAVRDRDSGSFASSGGQAAVVALDPARADRVVRALTLDGVTLRAGVVAGATASVADQPLDDCVPGKP